MSRTRWRCVRAESCVGEVAGSPALAGPRSLFGWLSALLALSPPLLPAPLPPFRFFGDHKLRSGPISLPFLETRLLTITNDVRKGDGLGKRVATITNVVRKGDRLGNHSESNLLAGRYWGSEDGPMLRPVLGVRRRPNGRMGCSSPEDGPMDA